MKLDGAIDQFGSAILATSSTGDQRTVRLFWIVRRCQIVQDSDWARIILQHYARATGVNLGIGFATGSWICCIRSLRVGRSILSTCAPSLQMDNAPRTKKICLLLADEHTFQNGRFCESTAGCRVPRLLRSTELRGRSGGQRRRSGVAP